MPFSKAAWFQVEGALLRVAGEHDLTSGAHNEISPEASLGSPFHMEIHEKVLLCIAYAIVEPGCVRPL